MGSDRREGPAIAMYDVLNIPEQNDIVLSINLYKVSELIHATSKHPQLGVLIMNPANTFLHPGGVSSSATISTVKEFFVDMKYS
jgi:hypothetical protein